jgi:hypothetical protein
LGHVVTTEGILPDPSKLDAIETWPTPTNVKEVRSWLGTRTQLCHLGRLCMSPTEDLQEHTP